MAYGELGNPMYSRYYYGQYGPYYRRMPRSDDDIAADLRNRMQWDSWVDAEDVRIEVHNGVVSLRGDADSAIEKRAAGDDAWDTPGVVDVNNEIRIH